MSDTAIVDLNQGRLRGKISTSKSGKTFYSYLGVPYAKPPLGSLRFKLAEPPEPWSGVRDALEEGSMCTQYDSLYKHYGGSEDCLYLNVFSPQLPTSGSEQLKPVMVFIHGGGLVYGSGSIETYGPDYLVDEGVVLVTINYRLGIFGFLYMQDSATPGNVGLKDQVAALRWVQDNIAKFGGDPNNVTIFGESAGGSSVHLHTLSPLSKGLFHRAIAMSGVAFSPWAVQKYPREAALQVAAALGFNGHTSEELVEFLRGIDHMVLLKASWEHGLLERDKELLIVFAFVSTVEVEVEGVERFLIGDPVQLMEEGRYQEIPFMTGVVENEGLCAWPFADFEDKNTVARMGKNLDKVILPDLRIPENYGKSDMIVSKLRKFFLKDKPLSEETLPQFFEMYSDVAFVEGVHITAKRMAQLDKAPLYYYKFSHEGSLNIFKIRLGIKLAGASHIDELGYLFRVKMVDSDLSSDSPDAITRARIVKLWTNFAKTGNPTPDDDPLLPVKWEQHTVDNPCYLQINGELSVQKHIFKERMQFWEDLYSNI